MSLTEASPMSDPQVISLLDNLRNISNEIEKIDNELGTDSGGVTAQRNKIANQYVSQYLNSQGQDENGREKNDALRFIQQAVPAIGNIGKDNPEILAAVYTELTNQLSKQYGDVVKNHLQKVVDAQPKTETPEVSEARKAELSKLRSDKAQLFKLQNEILKIYGVLELPSDIKPPPVRRGPVGKRVSIPKEFQFYVDGKLKQITDDDGNKSNYKLSTIATAYGKDLNWKVTELRNHIIENVEGAQLSEDGSTLNLPDEWEVTLPAPVNKTIRAVAVNVTNASSVDDEDDDDDDGTEESSDF